MRPMSNLTGSVLARRMLYFLAIVVFAALWTPFGLVVGLFALTVGALSALLWLFMDKLHSHGRLCSACQFYKGIEGAIGRCTLDGQMVWPKATVCDRFVAKAHRE